jgi:plastocyanin
MFRPSFSKFALLVAFGVGAVNAPSAFAAGSIKGSVKLNGKAPERKELSMKGDPFCAKQAATKDEEVVVGPANQLKNAVVRIAKGAPAGAAAPTTPAVLDQQGCMYKPRVVVVQAGQQVEIKNSDQTLHNVHTYKGPATLFNLAQP